MSDNHVEMLDGWQFHGVFKAVCVRCKHKHRTVRPVCDAFPTGIPKEIWMGENDHGAPYPGDRGIRFEPVIEPAWAKSAPAPLPSPSKVQAGEDASAPRGRQEPFCTTS